MSKRVLITGISGQDGSYLAEHLLDCGDQVFGILRRHSVAENQDSRIQHLTDKIETFYGDLLDSTSLTRIIQQVRPDEVYNLASQSHVRISFDLPIFTNLVNNVAVIQLLELLREFVPKARFYQASSSEMFGNSIDSDGFQRLTTPMIPVSPYGLAKYAAFNAVRHYRRAYKMFASNGILFNHTSPRRGINFVEAKIVKGLLEIKHGLRDKLTLGNLGTRRDFGHAKDYTRAMMAILDQPEPDDWIIATGENHSIWELVNIVATRIGLDDPESMIYQSERYMRPEELQALRGDSTLSIKSLGWKPEYSFPEIIAELVEHWEPRIVAKK